MLKLHGYCCLLAVFFRFCLPFFPFIFRVSVSTLQSRSCLTSFRCPAVSACLCVSRSFRTLFRVPYRGYVEFLFLCQKARMILCSAAVAVYVEATRLYTTAVYWRFFLFRLPLLFFNVSFLQPYAYAIALMYDSLCVSRSCLASFHCPAVSACVCVCPVLSGPSFV